MYVYICYCKNRFFGVLLGLLNTPMKLQQDLKSLLRDTLYHFWGYRDFRPLQLDIISAILEGYDTFALLPTGGGKSLCYQLPALVLEGTCIVVSPLLALMKDQVYQLQSRGIEAEYLSAELDDLQAEQIYSRCIEGITKILFVSPERLNNMIFNKRVEDFKISFLAVDEAHCISEWGQDFRPSYQNIQRFRDQLATPPPVLALTATATTKVILDIQERLGLKDVRIFRKSFKRENIGIYTEETSNKYDRVFQFLRNTPTSGIIYTATRKQAEQLTHYLKQQGISRVDFYHAGLSSKERTLKQDQWVQSPNSVLVSTNAFGMGIDKEDVRFVIHLSPPTSIENYYQEIGRAGRDGQQAFALLLWNNHELTQFDDLLAQQIPNKKQFVQATSYLYSLFQVAEHDLPEQTFQFNLNVLQKLTKIPQVGLKNILNFLHNQEIIYYNNQKSKSSVELNIEVKDFELLPKSDVYFVELLLRNLPGFSNYKVYFRAETLAKKMQIAPQLLKERLRELAKKDFINYIDGDLASIKFLTPRDSYSFTGKWWHLFWEIQKNKVQKWEEIKFFIQNQEICKSRLILAYFGEKNTKNCGMCSVCMHHKKRQNPIKESIISVLTEQPQTLEALAYKFPYLTKEHLLEHLMILLETEKIKMLNYKTYTINL